MIDRLAIVGFKRFRSAEFDLAPLTVLAGLNGSGKTSLIQSLLIAKEATRAAKSISLNGPFGMQLGTAEDVQNWHEPGAIQISLRAHEDMQYDWIFKVPAANALFLKILTAPSELPIALSGLPRSFTYLSAERLGPRVTLAASALPAEELEIGVSGEYCGHILSVLGNSPIVAAERVHPEHRSDSTLLKYEVEKWISEIVRPIEVEAVESSDAMAASIRFRSPGKEWVRATNMGFGVSYALPIVLAGLAALEGGLLIVENPEAHLHPAGQSRMGTFLAWLSGHGVQVLLETHSDHLLNGIRLAIGKYHYLSSSSAIAHFFDSTAEGEPEVKTLNFSEIGGVSTWPAGFFDQYQIDVSSLGRIRRRG